MAVRPPLPKVDDCIAYIESTDYRLVVRGRVYRFHSENRPPEFRTIVFTLTELRHAYLYGF